MEGAQRQKPRRRRRQARTRGRGSDLLGVLGSKALGQVDVGGRQLSAPREADQGLSGSFRLVVRPELIRGQGRIGSKNEQVIPNLP